MATWSGLSKLTPCSMAEGVNPRGVVTGLGLRLELETPEEEPLVIPGRTAIAPGIRGAAPGSNALGLITRLAWMVRQIRQKSW